MRQLLLFVAGVIVGVIGVTLYEIFGKPTLPSEDDGWISVKDRLPKDGDWAITYNQEDARIEVYGWFGDYYDVGFMNDVLTSGFKATHWMPLPEPPTD